jgi:hypothetical protein
MANSRNTKANHAAYENPTTGNPMVRATPLIMDKNIFSRPIPAGCIIILGGFSKYF